MQGMAIPTPAELQSAASVAATRFAAEAMAPTAIASAAAAVRQMLFADGHDVDVTARQGYVCNHEGPEGDCDWTLYTPDERCPFHGVTTRGTKIVMACSVPLDAVQIEVVKVAADDNGI
jgi:hypothetical protein